MAFSDFNFDERLLEGLQSMNYLNPTTIQEQSIPIILNNKDLIACAQTGTGKTGAYILPILNKIIKEEARCLNTLIISPTRELAQQIDQQIEGFAYFLPVSSLSIYGGGDGNTWNQQKKALQEGTDIIIATPGRLIAQLTSGFMDLSTVKHLVLDEADRMLEMGFYDDIIRIISYLPENRQTLLFSATMPPKIRALASKILKQPEEISIAISKPAEGISQQVFLVYDQQKIPLIKHILSNTAYSSVIIFSSTKENVKTLAKELSRLGLAVKAFHSDLEQEERENLLREFKSRQLQILVGTDVLSRGIDVEGIDLVVNFDLPPNAEDYIHRIGRTARAAAKGTAVSLVNEKEQHKLFKIQRLMDKEIMTLELPEALGPGPALKTPSDKNNNAHKKRGKFKKRWNNKKGGGKNREGNSPA